MQTIDYSKIYFSIEENMERYREYQKANPEMDAEEVVWRVNSNLDKEKYEFTAEVSDAADMHVLVNKYFKLPHDFCPPDLVSVEGYLLRKEAARAYEEMREEAKRQGFSISLSSGPYRTIEYQEKLYQKFLVGSTPEAVDKTCARPGHSEHHTGLAIDIQGSIPGGNNIGKTPEAAWLRENCLKYGFILRYLPETTEITGYASEPWHFRYVGRKVSLDMAAKNIKTFEEYAERFLKPKKIGK